MALTDQQKTFLANHFGADLYNTAKPQLAATWSEASERISSALAALTSRLKSDEDALAQVLAEANLVDLGRREQNAVAEALRALDAGKPAKKEAVLALKQMLQWLDNSAAVRLLDKNPFGVDVAFAKTLKTAISDIGKQLNG